MKTTINEMLRKNLIGKTIGPTDLNYKGWKIVNAHGEQHHSEIVLDIAKGRSQDYIVLNFDEEFDLV